MKFIPEDDFSDLLDLVGLGLAVPEWLQIENFINPFFMEDMVISLYSFGKPKTLDKIQ